MNVYEGAKSKAPQNRCAGQASLEALLILTLVVLALVAMPDNVIERLMIAIEGRHQAILKHVAMP
ncbi:MAG: hypothetical protein FJY25_05310 [Betaproteobacteria bacterium]|nr:hypothetical protein [Betaproteobacteria bacterium]